MSIPNQITRRKALATIGVGNAQCPSCILDDCGSGSYPLSVELAITGLPATNSIEKEQENDEWNRDRRVVAPVSPSVRPTRAADTA